MTMNTSAPVDVLAVMDRMCEQASEGPHYGHCEAVAARAAVEELVEHANTASKVLHNIIEAYVPTKHRAAHIADVAAFRAAIAKFA